MTIVSTLPASFVAAGHDRLPSASAAGPRVAVLGPYIVDVLGRPVSELPPGQGGILLEEIRMTVAGTGGGAAVDLAKLGCAVDCYGAIGADGLGAFLRSQLTSYGVDICGLVEKDGLQTSSTMLPIRANGERPSMHVQGATRALRADDLDVSALAQADALLLGGPEAMPDILGEKGAAVVDGFRETGRPVFADLLHSRPAEMQQELLSMLGRVDWFMPNDEQLRACTGIDDLAAAAAKLIADTGVGTVAVTTGGDGALLVRRGAPPVTVPAFATRVVDTTGCGDSFNSGVITAVLGGCSPEDSVLLGCACGALVASGLGSDAGIVDLPTVLDFMGQEKPEAATRIRAQLLPVDGSPVTQSDGGGAQVPGITAPQLEERRIRLARRARDIAKRGVVLAGAGNISERHEDLVFITRGGLRFESAEPEDICVLTLRGELLCGSRPSSETLLHLGVYQCTEALAVVHTHGRSTVAVGLVEDELPVIHYNILRLGGRVPTVPYFPFGSEELAESVGASMAAGSRSVLLRNHGAVSCGSTLDEAIEFSELTEWLCEVYLSARVLGAPARLNHGDLTEVRRRAAEYGNAAKA
ncbi:PfkB family carbohydrate kinase [Brevibacterium salitolerans]|uniref:PfkB family carbohydrate kinase n=1 Tax=Brevibacterium salitolerans TaxID=1403566 RepID=UPI0031CE57F7